MNLEVLADQIEGYRSRLAELSDLGPIAVEPTELLDRMSAVLELLTAAHDELRAQEQRLASASGELDAARRENAELWDSAPYAQLLTDATGAVLRANAVAERLFEIPVERLAGQKLPQLVGLGHRDRVRDIVGAAARGTTELRSLEITLDRPRLSNVVLTVWPLRTRDVLRITLQDVTERRMREDALEKTCQALEARLNAEIARGRLLEQYGKPVPPRERRARER